MLYLSAQWGYRIAEVPVAWSDAPGSKVDKAKEIKRFLRDLFYIKGNDLRGNYANPTALISWKMSSTHPKQQKCTLGSVGVLTAP